MAKKDLTGFLTRANRMAARLPEVAVSELGSGGLLVI